MKSNRPVNLSLGMVLEVNMKSPVAMASILHRISGIVVFLLIPVLLYILQGSLASEADFNAIKNDVFGGFIGRFVVFVALAGLIYHFFAGIKHLVMDFGVAEELQSGRTFATAILAISAVFIALAFVWVVL
ncbi:succinate dehydrogenase, cytochrome b556 subunit [Agitococcus lubricus]|uniref:Succinate dehydrogenase cytochrome b556 subunit n=1 Tax=Agitococcus lubricus TaxID=1077255 RepID=A0A2T5ISZ7_9GAMM|nr:succinate dehydrogenase, cytochrome b556 subunit [Agitococcus lubricus]PTQ86954.1 succinate dehydrogenase subunit C [Agitococcus lubricus]